MKDTNDTRQCCEKCSGRVEDENGFASNYGCQNESCPCHVATPSTEAKKALDRTMNQIGDSLEMSSKIPFKSTPEHGSIMDVVEGRSKDLYPAPATTEGWEAEFDRLNEAGQLYSEKECKAFIARLLQKQKEELELKHGYRREDKESMG